MTEAEAGTGFGSGLADAFRSLRDRLLSSRGFIDFALRFPPTAPIARARARSLFDLCAGFVYSQVLYACVKLRLFEMLAAGPDSAENLAGRLALPHDALRRLLDAACGLRLIERRGRRFGLGPLGAAMLATPGTRAMVEHHALLYADLADPVALLRGAGGRTHVGGYWPYARDSGAGDAGPYTALMAGSQAMVAAELLRAIPFARHRCLLDVGGGDGTFLLAAARAAPRLRLMLLDLPPVAAQALEKLAEAGLGDRATTHGGDFHETPLPRGADIATLVRVLHDHDDDEALALLTRVREALEPGGLVAIAEPMAGVRGAESAGAYFAVYLLAMGRGRPRTPAEVVDLLRAAGFAGAHSIRTRAPLIASVVSAVKQ